MSIPIQAKRVLDLIGGVEAPRGYNTLYGNRPWPKKLTEMTLKEVLDNQRDHWRKPLSDGQKGSSASGRYQFMRDTLLDLAVKYKLKAEQKFDADFQDEMGYRLLQRRDFDPWLKGQISTDSFMEELAKEWASFPVPQDQQGAHRRVARGESYYAGDEVNKALISPEKVWLALEAIRKGPAEPAAPVPKPELEIDEKEFEAMLQKALPILLPHLIGLLKPKIEEMLRRPEIPIQASAPIESTAREVATELAREIQANPSVIVPPKPTLKSTTIHGLIVAGLGLAASALGFTVTDGDAEAIVALGGQIITGVGIVWAWIGRQKAVQPLGAPASQ